jgi:hypothetical protein
MAKLGVSVLPKPPPSGQPGWIPLDRMLLVPPGYLRWRASELFGLSGTQGQIDRSFTTQPRTDLQPTDAAWTPTHPAFPLFHLELAL